MYIKVTTDLSPFLRKAGRRPTPTPASKSLIENLNWTYNQQTEQSEANLSDFEPQKNINIYILYRLLISNIRLAILNMHQYVCHRAVSLQGDKKDQHDEKLQEKGIGDQLAAIIAHIEDLQVVNSRVQNSDLTKGYMNPLASDKSEIRLDY